MTDVLTNMSLNTLFGVTLGVGAGVGLLYGSYLLGVSVLSRTRNYGTICDQLAKSQEDLSKLHKFDLSTHATMDKAIELFDQGKSGEAIQLLKTMSEISSVMDNGVETLISQTIPAPIVESIGGYGILVVSATILLSVLLCSIE